MMARIMLVHYAQQAAACSVMVKDVVPARNSEHNYALCTVGIRKKAMRTGKA